LLKFTFNFLIDKDNSKFMTPLAAYRDLTLGTLLTQLATDHPDQEALIYPQRQLRYTFADLETRARQVAKGLLKLGIQPGERVALWATNEPEWVVLQFALAKIGAILVTVNTSFRTAELAYLLAQSEACAIITIGGLRDVDYVAAIYELVPELLTIPLNASEVQPRVLDVQRHVPHLPPQLPTNAPDIEASALAVQPLKSARLPFLRHALFINAPAMGVIRALPATPNGFLELELLAQWGADVTDEALDARAAAGDLDEVINMQYTSGTTGFPKGVMLSHRNIVNNGYWLGEAMGLTPQDRLCLPVPLFHCFGCVIGVLGAYTHAVGLVPLEYFDPLRVLQLVAAEKCTALYGVPTMFVAALEVLEKLNANDLANANTFPDAHNAPLDLSSLRTGIMAGALCPEMLMQQVMEKMHLREMVIAYGLTEASPGITHTRRQDTLARRTQTVGKVMPELEVKIIDPITRAVLPVDTAGELCVRGYNVMRGYYRNPAATDEALISLAGQSGWLRTGDQATIDPAGYVRITGRIKEIIIRGGENIAPKEVEDCLRHFEKVADVYVYSVPSQRYGEEVAAAIRLKADVSCTVEEVLAYCATRLARFKIPRYIRFVTDFPVTASGKVQRYRLREMHLALMGAAD
jgi:fatty-acyl-CoA synthase